MDDDSDGEVRRGQARSVGLAVLVGSGVGVVENGEVGSVARLGNEVLLKCVAHGASWFVRVCAIGVSAVSSDSEYLWEIVRCFGFVEIDRSKPFHTRSVDDVSSVVEAEHFREGGGVHSGVVDVGNLGSAEIQTREQCVDDGRFSDAGIA